MGEFESFSASSLNNQKMILTQSMVSVNIVLMVFMQEANSEPQRWRGPPGYGQQFWPRNMYYNYRVAKPNHPGEFRPDTSRPVNHPPNWPPPKDRYRSGYGMPTIIGTIHFRS